MRKFFAIVTLIILAVLLYLYGGRITQQGDGSPTDDNILNEKKVLKGIRDNDEKLIAKVKELQKNVASIADFNAMITKILYADNDEDMLTEEDVEKIVKFQRLYFHEDMLKKNPEAVMIVRLQKELKKYKELGIKVIGYDAIAPEYVHGDKYNTVVKVKYYMNHTGENGEIHKAYFFEMGEDRLWRMIEVGNVEEFPIVE